MMRVLKGLTILLIGFAVWYFFASSNEPPLPTGNLSEESGGLSQTETAVLVSGAPVVPLTEPKTTATAPTPSSSAEKLTAVPTKKTLPLTDNQGRLLLMSQSMAFKACAAKGMHLPTARELADVIRQWGGKGIVKDRDEKGMRIVVRNFDGKVDDFFYSNEGHKVPSGEIGNFKAHDIVSSSVDANPEYPSDIPCIVSLGWVSDGFTLRCSGYYDLVTRQSVPEHERDNHSDVLCMENNAP